MRVRNLWSFWGQPNSGTDTEDNWINPTLFNARARDVVAVLFILAAIGAILYAALR